MENYEICAKKETQFDMSQPSIPLYSENKSYSIETPDSQNENPPSYDDVVQKKKTFQNLREYRKEYIFNKFECLKFKKNTNIFRLWNILIHNDRWLIFIIISYIYDILAIGRFFLWNKAVTNTFYTNYQWSISSSEPKWFPVTSKEIIMVCVWVFTY